MAHLIVCPHCEMPGVTVWAARWSGPALPATCQHCRGLSHVPSSNGIDVFTGGIAFASIAVLLMGPWLITSVLGVALAVALNLWAWRRVELLPTFADRVRISRRVDWIASLLALLSLLF